MMGASDSVQRQPIPPAITAPESRKREVRIIGGPAIAGPAGIEATAPEALVHHRTPRPAASFMDRYRPKFCHDLMFDVFEGVWLEKARGWRATADDLRVSHPDQALACENHATFIETYWPEWFELDYRAVNTELDGFDPVEIFLTLHETRFEETA